MKKQKVEEVNQSLLIDTIGGVRAQLKALKAREENLMPQLKALNLHIGLYSGDAYAVNISEKTSREYSPEKAFKKLGKDVFLRVVKVIVSKLKEHVTSVAEIDELVEGEPTLSKEYTFMRK